MSMQRNFNHNPYPDYSRGSSINHSSSPSMNHSSSSSNNNYNHDNHSDNDSNHHRMNQHSLQQRGKFSSHRQSPSNTPERRSKHHGVHNTTGTHAYQYTTNTDGQVKGAIGAGGPFTPPRPSTVSTTSASVQSNNFNTYQNIQGNKDQNKNNSISSSTTDLEKLPTPIMTAKNARNFWKSKVEKPIKVWKKPTNTNSAATAAVASSSAASINSINMNSPSRNSIASSSKSSGVFSNINSRGSVSATSGNEQQQQQPQHHDHHDDTWAYDEAYDDKPKSILQKKKQRPLPNKLWNQNTANTMHGRNHYQQQQQQQQQQHQQNQHQQNHPDHNPEQLSQKYPNVYTKRWQGGIHDNSHNNKNLKSRSNDNNKSILDASNDPAIGEMQIKLDIAAAQLLTEEMKYKDLNEQYRRSQDDYEEKISILNTDLHRLKREETKVRDHYTLHIRELENNLKNVQMELQQVKYDQNQDQQEDNSKVNQLSNENEQLKHLIDEQKNELNELCIEVQRLHDNHKADSGISNHKIRTMEKEKNDEIAKLRVQLEEQNKKISSMPPSNNKHENGDDVDAIKSELDRTRQEFSKLAEETNRLENELEAVTEDRDALLRRSVLYHNPSSEDEGKINSPDDKGKKKILSSMAESSVQHYEFQRVKEALKESELICHKQESRIQELEKLLHNDLTAKGMDSIDLSAIDLENASFFSVEKHGKIVSLEELNRVQKECTQYKRDATDAKNRFNEVEKERDVLKECLGEAMNEVEKLQSDKTKTKQRHEEFTEELLQTIKERDAEIEQLHEKEKTISSGKADVDISDPLREDLLNMVGWLNSSNRINGSPSIECMLTQDPVADNGEDSEQPSDEFNKDDPAIQSLYKHVKDLQNKLNSAQNEIIELKESKERNTTDADGPIDSQSLQLAAEQASEEIWNLLNDLEDIDNSTSAVEFMEHLRSLLEQTADLIMAMRKQISTLESQDRIAKVTAISGSDGKSVSAESNQSDEDESEFGKLIKVSPFELGMKEDEITQLKVTIGQLREELRESNEQISSSRKNGEFEEMPTPTKSNLSTKKEFDSSLLNPAQSSNEEEDVRARMTQAEFNRLKKDLKNKINAEETLKTIIRDHATRITRATAQAETLAQEKYKLENAMKDLEKQKVALEENVSKAHTEISSLQEKIRTKDSSNTEDQNEVVTLKTKLKNVSKERKKLKKSLAEAVEMLNALQEHVVTAEKERKKTKKQLKTALASGNLNKSTDSRLSESALTENADQTENQTIILQLKSHIVALDHEITTLHDRIDELESLKLQNQTKTGQDQISKLQDELRKANTACEMTKAMYDKIVLVNKELLNDLKATEKEEAETIEELETLKRTFYSTQRQVDKAISMAASTLQKFNNYMTDSADQELGDNHSIVDVIKSVERCSELIIEKLTISERALEEKNVMLLELLGGDMI